MRHAKSSQRLSMSSDQKKALVNNLLKSLVERDRIKTTLARAKETQRMADRLVTLGKEGSVHARRQAFRVLQNRTLVKRLFDDIAPRFEEVDGGYTRVVRVAVRRGDGATMVQLAFSRVPEVAVLYHLNVNDVTSGQALNLTNHFLRTGEDLCRPVLSFQLTG